MEVELPEAPSCQEESSMQKRKRDNGEKRSDSPEGTSLVVDSESLLVVDSRSDLVLERAQPCEADQQASEAINSVCSNTIVEATMSSEAPISAIQELNGNSDQSGESNCLPLKKRQRVEPNNVNNGMSSTKKDEIMLDKGENTCGVLLEVVGLDNQGEAAREMALCHADEARIAQLHCENSAFCKEDINGDILCHSDAANCSELENEDCKDMVVESEGEAILVHSSLEIASAEIPANSAGKEPMLKDGDFQEDLKLHIQDGGTQAVELCKSFTLETEENKDIVEVQLAEQHKSHLEEASEAASNDNGGALPLPNSDSFKENPDHHMKTDNKEATPFVSQDLSKDNVMEKDIVSKEDAPQPLLNNSSHISATEVTKKKLLILDLNGLLADIIPYCNERYTHDFVVNRKYVYKRPHVDDFLQFCFERFAVAIWSSRTKRNIEPLLELLIGPSQGKLLFCWDQYHCTQTRFTTVDNSDKPLVFKELCKVWEWEKHYDNLPWEKGQYNESNTLLLDDSPYKALLNPANTAIFPYSYRYTRIHDNSLGPGGDLRVYLERLAVADNVQEYVRDNPFGQRPITESTPSWYYYERVMRSYSHRDYPRESRRDDARNWSHRDDAGKWSHRYDARKWSHRDDARESRHEDARESRHEDAGKLPKDDAKESRRDYAGKSPKDEARQSETHTGDVGESTSTVN